LEFWPWHFSRRHGVTIVAECGKTSVYVNGRKTGENYNQIVRPLRRLGSVNGNSFTGHARGLKVWNRNFTPSEITGFNKEVQ
jgi:hypothetical protein